MKTLFSMSLVRGMSVAWLLFVSGVVAFGQGTITFDAHPWWSGTTYSEQGMTFLVVVSSGASTYDDMGILPSNAGNNVPQNSTPFMNFYRQNNPSDYVSFGLTSGSSFGLTSVFLADPTSPSLTALPITFKGFKADGSTISQTFTTSGNNATTLLPYTFNAVFASGLTSVEIDATRWAMDNLVFTVPEPSTLALLGLGAAALASRRLKRR